MSTFLPPGKYFIGDPCYVFDKKWSGGAVDRGICDVILDGGEQVFEGREFYAHFTAYGDGVYPGSNGFAYGVDAGLLGAIPVELIEEQPGPEDGTIIDAPKGLDCDEVNGVFTFHAWGGERITINTSGESDEEDDYNDEEDDTEF